MQALNQTPLLVMCMQLCHHCHAHNFLGCKLSQKLDPSHKMVTVRQRLTSISLWKGSILQPQNFSIFTNLHLSKLKFHKIFISFPKNDILVEKFGTVFCTFCNESNECNYSSIQINNKK